MQAQEGSGKFPSETRYGGVCRVAEASRFG